MGRGMTFLSCANDLVNIRSSKEVEMEEYRKAWREIAGILLAGLAFLVLTVGGDVIGELLQRGGYP